MIEELEDNEIDMAHKLYNIYSTNVILVDVYQIEQNKKLGIETNEPDRIEVPFDINLEHVCHYYPAIDDKGNITDRTRVSILGAEYTILTPFNKFRTVLKSFWHAKNSKEKSREGLNTE